MVGGWEVVGGAPVVVVVVVATNVVVDDVTVVDESDPVTVNGYVANPSTWS
jgi:hypothetical protein